MPSSVMFGSRPRICLTRAYSSVVRPCSAAISGVTLISVAAVAIFSQRKNEKRREISRFAAQRTKPVRQKNWAASLEITVRGGGPTRGGFCGAQRGWAHDREIPHPPASH